MNRIKLIKSIFLVLFGVLSSCSESQFIEEELCSDNCLEINYLGYWESKNGGSINVVTFDEIRSEPSSIILSSGEVIDLVKIKATSSISEDFIQFSILKNQIGVNVLFNQHFTYRVGWPTYNGTPRIKLTPTINNEKELKATFSGELEHWNNGTKVLQILKINYGKINVKY
jgi:hypothetical protein